MVGRVDGRVGLVTYHKEPALTDDDRPLMDACARAGLSATPARWDAPGACWADFDALVLRSCWDYHLRPLEFADWLGAMERLGIPMWNPYAVIRWNTHKSYLRGLAAAGVLIPDTEWLIRGEAASLPEILERRGWREAIVKPAISASATDTWRASADAADVDARLAAQTSRGDVLVQEIIPEVATRGEWSLIFIDGAYSHAAIKKPRAGDFRVQWEHGGSAEPAKPAESLVDAGGAIARRIPSGWLYARIDVVETSRGCMLMEVECIEPHLFFSFAPESRDAFARALRRLLG